MKIQTWLRTCLEVVGGTAVLALVSASAQAASPTYWDDRTAFEDSLTQSVTDDYSAYTLFAIYTDAEMSAVVGETDYETTGFADTNYITDFGSGNIYCGGCTSFELSFLTTSVGSSDGVQGVGLDVIEIDTFTTPYYAYITFSDGTTDEVLMPGPGSFWAVSAPEPIESVHFGLSGGAATMNGWLYIDNLTIGRQLCGNGVLDSGEDCDDAGETIDCDSNCTFVSCGDGTRNSAAGEQCDTAGDSASCDQDCTFVECGDLYVNTVVELCDDGSGETAICDADCTAAQCGDATWNATAGEECDDGGDSLNCDANCTLALCGDGQINEIALEECDDSGESLTCDLDCTFVECGDGVLNATVGEICDDPKGSAECDVDCTAPECGDGLWNALAGEECDGDGKGTPGETVVCDLDCTMAECGDGVINETLEEECDDGNLSDSDGCSSLCFIDEPSGSSGGESGSSGGGESDTGSGDPDSGVDSSASTTMPVDPTSGGSEDTDTDTDGPSAVGDSGCGCSSPPDGSGGILPLFVLLLAARRRAVLGGAR